MEENKFNAAGGFLLFLIIFGIILIPLVFFMGFRQVDAGEVSVVTNFGEVTGKTLEPGANFITPFVQGTITYNTKKVTYET